MSLGDNKTNRSSEIEAASLPPFQPRMLVNDDLDAFYDDGRIRAGVEAMMPKKRTANGSMGGGILTIYEWSSFFPGRGCTTQALEWFRGQGYDHIVAMGVGTIEELNGRMVGDSSTNYWLRMHSKGLVDELFDDDMQKIDVAKFGSAVEERHAPAITHANFSRP